MPKDLAKVFDACQKAVGIVFTEGKCTATQLRDLANGYLAIRSLIRDLTEEHPKYQETLERAFEYVHPGRELSVEMMIRDLADIAVTIGRLRDGKSRTLQIKLAEATMFCQQFRNELRDLA